MLRALGSQRFPVSVGEHECLDLFGKGLLIDRTPVVIVLVVDQGEAVDRHARRPDHFGDC
jgi:hypothetical protein